MAAPPIALGLRQNWVQFALLVAVNVFVGAMVGLERTILPFLARDDFGVSSYFVTISFVASFGFTKALSNLAAGRLSARFGRRRLLIIGWLAAIPVAPMLLWGPSWGWVVVANLFLGVNQGLAWSMTVNMKIDLVGPGRRGLALGINEAAGYLAVAGAAFLTGVIAAHWGLRPAPFYLGLGFTACGLALSVLYVRDTSGFVALESRAHGEPPSQSLTGAFAAMSWRQPHLLGIAQAGFVNNLNDALAWVIFPLLFAAQGLSLDRIAMLAAVYPLTWGCLQLITGWASDHVGRKLPVVTGMLLQAFAIAAVVMAEAFGLWLMAVVALGAGTALVYPVLLAAVGDLVHPEERATILGVYRFWRDAGTMAGALLAGMVADLIGVDTAVMLVAALTAASALGAMVLMQDGRPNVAVSEATP